MALFFPTLYRRRVTDITVADLHRLGVEGILLDVDNTLTTHDAPDLTDEIKGWLVTMQEAGFRLLIVSNNTAQRVAPFAQSIGLPYYAKAKKPLPGGFWAAGKQLGLAPCRCAVVGDQLFTDMLGANLAGIPSVLLEPISLDGETSFIRFKRRVERLLLSRARQRKKKETDYGEQ
ncbi:MAG: YqeG family HAD IIIA-type phosphatase [Clostridia bacterium]|nr:YqeG family HAD IIIA-type phosphatase [Clostridia bacterium]